MSAGYEAWPSTKKTDGDCATLGGTALPVATCDGPWHWRLGPPSLWAA